MSEVTDSFSDVQRFHILSLLAKACLVLPTSNGDSECIFSMLKKIQTDNRSELKNDTICALMVTKQNQDSACYNREHSDAVLKSAKKAVTTYQCNLQN